MMDQESTLQKLKKTGALISDSHIVYTSGRHGSSYVNKDAIYPHTADISELCRRLSVKFMNFGPEVVAAPAIGGVILTQWTAHHLNTLSDKGNPVFAIYAEKAEDGESFVIKRGYEKLIPCKRVLVVEDVLTTGGSARRVVEAVRKAGGDVIGVGALCNRGKVTKQDVGEVPRLLALCNIKMQDWPEEECPLCKKGVPINIEVGKGAEFLSQKIGK
jgi:orotate phosphoribosyltransferase